MQKRLKNKVAIVVGAGQTPGETIGNGRAISITLARQGAKVILVDCQLESALETKRMIDEEGGISIALKGDITSDKDCRDVVEKTIETYGCVDILVNVVGISGEGTELSWERSESLWDKIMEVNLKGTFLMCKNVIPVMEVQERGVVINISSAAAIATTSASAKYAYKTSKAGVNALTHGLAMQFASKGIRVNAVMPGMMDTPMAMEGIPKVMKISKEELRKKRSELVPLKGGMGDGWDIANAVLFLASDEAKFITSVILPVDGGRTARIG